MSAQCIVLDTSDESDGGADCTPISSNFLPRRDSQGAKYSESNWHESEAMIDLSQSDPEENDRDELHHTDHPTGESERLPRKRSRENCCRSVSAFNPHHTNLKSAMSWIQYRPKRQPFQGRQYTRFPTAKDDSLPDLSQQIGAVWEVSPPHRHSPVGSKQTPAVSVSAVPARTAQETVAQVSVSGGDNLTKLKTRRTKEEREALKAAKEEEKKRKALEKEVARSTKPGECMKYVRVSVDKNILDAASVTELMDAFLEADIGADTAELPLERSVLWSRKHLSLDEARPGSSALTSEVQENQVAVVLPADQFLRLVASERQDPLTREHTSLSEHLTSVEALYPDKRVTYLVFEIEKYFRREKRKANEEYRALILGTATQAPKRKKTTSYDGPKLTRDNIETVTVLPELELFPRLLAKHVQIVDFEFKANTVETGYNETLVPLQLERHFNVHYVETANQLSKLLTAFTKAVAERLHKQAKQGRDLHFLAPGGGTLRKHDSLLRVWQAQLEQFASVGRDMAEAIVTRYPSPRLLLQAFEACADPSQAEVLLQDIL
ncbi:hypothetical protein HPB47_010645, partial [Ixodes persulcatus]